MANQWTTYCRKCGAEMNPGDKVCPRCWTPVKRPLTDRPLFWIGIILAVILVFGTVVGIIGASVAKNITSQTVAVTRPTDPRIPSAVAELVPDPTPAPAVAAPTEGKWETPATEDAVTETRVPGAPQTVESLPPADSSDLVSTQDVADLIEATISENFTNCVITCEDDTITINVWEEGVAAAAIIAVDGNAEYASSWADLVENMNELSASLVDFTEAVGRSDILVIVNVLNDQNTEKVLLTSAGGITVYDAVAEASK